jgi:hypothetical protein
MEIVLVTTLMPWLEGEERGLFSEPFSSCALLTVIR